MSAAAEPLVAIERLCKTYRGAAQPALDGVDLAIAEGDFFALLGPNGAGKTTLISMLCGLFGPSSGEIRVRAPSGAWLAPRAARAHMGLVPQELAFYPTLSVTENLCYFGAMHGLSGAALRAGVEAGLTVGRLQEFKDRRAENLSGGLKRRLSLAIGVVHRPRLLVLDEPTAGVDAQSRRYLSDELRRLNAAGTTIVYTSHYLNEVQQLCNTVAVIDKGKVIAQGGMRELLQRDAVTLAFAAEPSPLLLERLRAMDGVSGVIHDGNQVALITDRLAPTLAAALGAAHACGAVVTEANMGHRDLEALFFQLTGKTLRDQETQPHAA